MFESQEIRFDPWFSTQLETILPGSQLERTSHCVLTQVRHMFGNLNHNIHNIPKTYSHESEM